MANPATAPISIVTIYRYSHYWASWPIKKIISETIISPAIRYLLNLLLIYNHLGQRGDIVTG